MKKIHVIGEGTVFHVRPHIAISAVAYGVTAKMIAKKCKEKFNRRSYKIELHLTKMACAGQSEIETNMDVKKLIDKICLDSDVKILFLPVALCDFSANIIQDKHLTDSGKDQPRLKSRQGAIKMELLMADKLISGVKKQHPNLFLVGFKTTSNISGHETIRLSKKLLNESNCDLVFGNDIAIRKNIIVGKNNYVSELFSNRDMALEHLVELTAKLS